MRLKLRFYILRLELEAAAPTSASLPPHLPTPTPPELLAAVRAAVLDAAGDTGLGLVQRTLALRALGRLVVVRGPAGSDASMRAALVLLRAVRGRPVALRMLAVAGSARTLSNALRRLGVSAPAGLEFGRGGPVRAGAAPMAAARAAGPALARTAVAVAAEAVAGEGDSNRDD